MADKEMTYEEARELAIFKWTELSKGRWYGEVCRDVHEKFGEYVMHGCGFCELFINSHCQGCPLFDAENVYEMGCCKEYDDWCSTAPSPVEVHESAYKKAALVMLEKIKKTPEHPHPEVQKMIDDRYNRGMKDE